MATDQQKMLTKYVDAKIGPIHFPQFIGLSPGAVKEYLYLLWRFTKEGSPISVPMHEIDELRVGKGLSDIRTVSKALKELQFNEFIKIETLDENGNETDGKTTPMTEVRIHHNDSIPEVVPPRVAEEYEARLKIQIRQLEIRIEARQTELAAWKSLTDPSMSPTSILPEIPEKHSEKQSK